MRSTFGGFRIASGQEGLDESQGSKSSLLPPGVRTMKVEWPSQVIESFCIYEFTNLRIYCGVGGLQELIASTGRRLPRISLLHRRPYDFPGKIRGIADARSCRMNPQAEALKKRTFKFGLQAVYFCRELR